MLADKELEIQRLNHLLDKERNERRLTELDIEQFGNRPEAQKYMRPHDIEPDKERQDKEGRKKLPL